VLHHASEIPAHIVDSVRSSPRSHDEAVAIQGQSLAARSELHRPFEFVEPEDVTSGRGRANEDFVPARDKLEVVNRISRSVGGPEEELGPGSKERKSVLLSVAARLDLPENVRRMSKHRLAEHLVARLGGSWDADCWSAGQTLTLEGLNRLLRGVETRFGPRAATLGLTPEEEAQAIVGIVVRHTPDRRVDGKSAIQQMRAAQSADWAKAEWPRFYFEYRTLGPLMTGLDGAPVPTDDENLVFDLRATHTWDLKVRRSGTDWTILNDRAATEWVLRSHGGVGLVVLTADMELDGSGSLAEWLDAERISARICSAGDSRQRTFRRTLKKSMRARRVDVYYFSDRQWADAVDQGVIRTWAQPPQPGGLGRRARFQIALDRAGAWTVASHEW
jgi:hypothetical protein